MAVLDARFESANPTVFERAFAREPLFAGATLFFLALAAPILLAMALDASDKERQLQAI